MILLSEGISLTWKRTLSGSGGSVTWKSLVVGFDMDREIGRKLNGLGLKLDTIIRIDNKICDSYEQREA